MFPSEVGAVLLECLRVWSSCESYIPPPTMARGSYTQQDEKPLLKAKEKYINSASVGRRNRHTERGSTP